jgi:hypothetical protein
MAAARTGILVESCHNIRKCRMSAFMTDTADALLQLLRSDGVVHSPCATLKPLSGGISSEIYRVDDGGETFVIKRALPKLKVQDDWNADPLA